MPRGAIRAGALRLAPRRWLGVTHLLLAVVVAWFVYGTLGLFWNPILMATGVVYYRRDIELDYECNISRSSEIQIKVDAVAKPPENRTCTGTVEVSLTQNGSALASWTLSGLLLRQGFGGVDVDGAQVVASLRDQVPPESDSSFAPLLHNEADAKMLGAAISSIAAKEHSSVGETWLHSHGKKINNFTSSSTGGSIYHIPEASSSWWTPVYVIPIVVFLGFLLLGIRTFDRRRSLVPFEPEPTAGLDVPSQAESKAELVT